MSNITLGDEIVVSFNDVNPGVVRVVKRTVLPSTLGVMALTSDKLMVQNVVLLGRYATHHDGANLCAFHAAVSRNILG